jgi:hypothetical protein
MMTRHATEVADDDASCYGWWIMTRVRDEGQPEFSAGKILPDRVIAG